MIKILLVDDEPLILAGIKSMLDWNAHGYEIIGTATTGQEALEQIERLCPDLVIADINMPVMNGMVLLEMAQEKYPSLVFILLTNLQDFELVQQSLRLKAVDYLIKTELQADQLLDSLSRGKEEVERRSSKTNHLLSKYQQENQELLLRSALQQAFSSAHLSTETQEILEYQGRLSQYALLFLGLLPNFSNFTNEKYKRFLFWMEETVEKIAASSFPNHMLSQSSSGRLHLFLWNLSERDFPQQLALFQKRLISISDNITGLEPIVLTTSIVSGAESFPIVIKQVKELQNMLYLTGRTLLQADQLEFVKYSSLPSTQIANEFSVALRKRDDSHIQMILSTLRENMLSTPHKKEEPLWLCQNLYQQARDFLWQLDPELLTDSSFWQREEEMTEQIEAFQTIYHTDTFLKTLEEHLLFLLEQNSENSSILLQKATAYIEENIQKRIYLQEVADAIHISPSYLSSLFRKETGKTFIDFINERKVEEAKKLLATKAYQIKDISDMLGFENAYYFSRVFRKYTGTSPSNYSKTN